MSDYRPINCGFHEWLLHFATKAEAVELELVSDTGEIISRKAIVKDVFTKDSAEYVLLDTEEVFRLDFIRRLAGMEAPGYCGVDTGG